MTPYSDETPSVVVSIMHTIYEGKCILARVYCMYFSVFHVCIDVYRCVPLNNNAAYYSVWGLGTYMMLRRNLVRFICD